MSPVMQISPPPRAGNHGAEELERSLLAAAQGDQDAFALFYRSLLPLVRAAVRRVLRDHGQSDEVTQEVIVELWASAGRYRPERGTVLGWAVTIAHRRAVDRVRYCCAQTRREERVAALAPPSTYAGVVECVERVLEHEAVRRCLDNLSLVQREAVCLAFFEGLTHVEVAARLGVPLGTAKSRIRDGLMRLRLELEQDR